MELKEEDLSEVQDELCDARIKWYNIGLRLAPDLDVIEKDGVDTEARFRSMLRKWLREGKILKWLCEREKPTCICYLLSGVYCV